LLLLVRKTRWNVYDEKCTEICLPRSGLTRVKVVMPVFLNG
jgi:hypothetical protein